MHHALPLVLKPIHKRMLGYLLQNVVIKIEDTTHYKLDTFSFSPLSPTRLITLLILCFPPSSPLSPLLPTLTCSLFTHSPHFLPPCVSSQLSSFSLSFTSTLSHRLLSFHPLSFLSSIYTYSLLLSSLAPTHLYERNGNTDESVNATHAPKKQPSVCRPLREGAGVHSAVYHILSTHSVRSHAAALSPFLIWHRGGLLSRTQCLISELCGMNSRGAGEPLYTRGGLEAKQI